VVEPDFRWTPPDWDSGNPDRPRMLLGGTVSVFCTFKYPEAISHRQCPCRSLWRTSVGIPSDNRKTGPLILVYQRNWAAVEVMGIEHQSLREADPRRAADRHAPGPHQRIHARLPLMMIARMSETVLRFLAAIKRVAWAGLYRCPDRRLPC